MSRLSFGKKDCALEKGGGVKELSASGGAKVLTKWLVEGNGVFCCDPTTSTTWVANHNSNRSPRCSGPLSMAILSKQL